MMKKHFTKSKIYICLVLIILSAVILPVKTLAFDQDFFAGNDILFYNPTCADTTGSSSSDGTLTGKNNREKIWCFLRTTMGLSKNGAIGVMGNLMRETGNTWEPNTWQGWPAGICDNKSNPNCGYGLAQWTAVKYKIGPKSLWKYAGETYPDDTGKAATLITQLEFLKISITRDALPKSMRSGAGEKELIDYLKDPNIDIKEAAYQYVRLYGYWEADLPRSNTANLQGQDNAIKISEDNSLMNLPCGNTTTSPTASGTNPTIVIDPGHTGSDDPRLTNGYIDPASGILDTIGSNGHEGPDVFNVATKLKALLLAKNYNVIMTKQSADDSPNSRKRADIANSANADLAISIHYDSAHSFGGWGQVYAQQNGLYRNKGSNGLGQKVYFNNTDLANKSIEYADKFVTARKANEGGPIERTTNNTFTARAQSAPGSIAGGNIPLVQLWSKVPWVYNESGAPSSGMTDSQMDEYAKGLSDGVVASVPPGSGGNNGGCSGGSSQAGASIVAIAKQELANPGDNTKYSGVADEWCAAFASWVYKEAGYPLTKGGEFWMHGTVTELIRYFKKYEMYIGFGTQDPQPGDMVYYGSVPNPDVTAAYTNSPGSNGMRHVALVLSYDASTKTITTIGGNESQTVTKSSYVVGANGDANAHFGSGFWIAGFGRIK